MKRFATPLLSVAIFLLNVLLTAPLFMAGELPFRGSIEGGYVGMARFLSEYPNPWGWNPLPYCGLPTQFMYVPAIPYVTAAGIRLLPHVSPELVYRTIVGLIACLGPVILFLFALRFTGGRRWALVAALAYTLFSPAYGLFPAVEKDRGIVQLPWRIQLLAKYGEGPHNTGLALLPLALLSIWSVAKRKGFAGMLPAALLLAVIPLINWVAAFSLAIACLLVMLAAWGEPYFAYWRVVAAAALAYLLACFWLTPTFIKTILFNWPVDSFGYRFEDKQAWLLAGLVGGAVLIRLLFRFLRGSFYFCLVTLGAFVFGWISTVYYLHGIDTIPESRRYAIEFELFLILALVEAIRLGLRNSNSTVRLCAMGVGGMLLLAGTPQLWAYATQGWEHWRPVQRESTVEFQIARWVAQQSPQGRVFASGGLRFRLGSWFDLPQVGGTFETGLQNRVPVHLAYRIRTGSSLRPGREAEDTLTALKAAGAEYVVIHGPKSREYYRDLLYPERFTATLPQVYRIEDDAVYALPRRPLAHVVRTGELGDEDPLEHPEALERYVAAVEDTSRPTLDARWNGASALDIRGPVQAGEQIGVQVNADPGWRARQDGRDIPVSTDRLGFIVVAPQPSATAHVELRYTGTIEQRLMAALSALAWCAVLLWSGLTWLRSRASYQRPRS